mmetsp:Transcript_5866/g.27142  ORF Transcript_5866/g.27142 Transcript_5866/m.27142 type:complete len:211 (-) Transcript_5866:2140-2772(-)
MYLCSATLRRATTEGSELNDPKPVGSSRDGPTSAARPLPSASACSCLKSEYRLHSTYGAEPGDCTSRWYRVWGVRSKKRRRPRQQRRHRRHHVATGDDGDVERVARVHVRRPHRRLDRREHHRTPRAEPDLLEPPRAAPREEHRRLQRRRGVAVHALRPRRVQHAHRRVRRAHRRGELRGARSAPRWAPRWGKRTLAAPTRSRSSLVLRR